MRPPPRAKASSSASRALKVADQLVQPRSHVRLGELRRQRTNFSHIRLSKKAEQDNCDWKGPMGDEQRQGMQNMARSLKSRRWLWGSIVATALMGLAGVAVWAGWSRDDLLEDVCAPPVSNTQQVGCVATVPIEGIKVRISSTIGLSRDGTRLLLGGALPHDKTKQVLQAFNIVERREIWRVPFDGLGFYAQLAISGDDSKVAAWASEPAIRIFDMQSGKQIIEFSTENPYTRHYYDVFFSQDDEAIVVGDAFRRRTLALSNPTAEPVAVPEFNGVESCQGTGFVGQSNTGFIRSHDGRIAVLLSAAYVGAPIRAREPVLTSTFNQYICGSKSVVLLDRPAGWSYAVASFSSFTRDNSRLAVVYSDMELGRETRTLIEVWSMSETSLERLAAFPVLGDVGYRIAWSADGRQLAAIRSNRAGKAEARIYVIP